MTSISLPPSQSSTLTHLETPHEQFYQNSHLKLSAGAPEPNPSFSFPAAPPPSHRPSASTSALNTEEDTSSPPPLPEFSFNPGASLPAATKPNVAPPPRPGGHRKRGSGYVADKPKSPVLPSSSPTKAENLIPPPPQLPPPGPGLSAPGPGRRGHAHRRSAAISSMDLTAISKAYPPKPVAGSAPTTPADMKQQHAWNEQHARPLSRSATSLNATTPPESPEKESKPEPQCKVEFVDKPSVAPRPLSTISSETTSSLSTIRANHSATGSLGSSSGHGISSNKTMPRPKSANPAFSFNQTTGFGDNPQLKRPLSASASASPPTSTNPGSIESFDMPPKKKHIWETTDPDSIRDRSEPESSSTTPSTTSSSPPSSSTANPLARTQSNRKSGKKKKKVRSWAGAILTRKGKRRPSKAVSKRTPTPPPNPPVVTSDDDSMSEVDFDEDNTVVLRTPTNPDAPKATLSSLHTNMPNTSLESSWKPKSFYDQGSELDMLSPVIDLDAALGPFNTPEMRTERPVTSSFSAATKRMYSGGRRGEFIGPEMRYHRRSESAPEMPPFDRSSMGRFGSNPALDNADVFDEEEEDAFLADNPEEADGKATSTDTVQGSTPNRSSRRDSSATVIAQTIDVQNETNDAAGLGIQVVDSAESGGSNSGYRSMAASQDNGQTSATQQPLAGQRPQESVEILEGDDLPSPIGKPPSSTSSPRCRSRFLHVEKRPASSPVDFAYAAAQAPPPMSESSGFPSPDPSNISFEAPHLATSSSSMTDHHPSNYSGRCHGSVDDVPSLTSSTSTTTNSMPRFSGSFFVRSSGDRSASFSTPVPRRTSQANASKRSSLASLSKLVGGSHGERSKLSHEEKAPGDECEKSKKKSNRLSRLMHFWKTKEKEKNQAKENID